jgi:hypothetical protein
VQRLPAAMCRFGMQQAGRCAAMDELYRGARPSFGNQMAGAWFHTARYFFWGRCTHATKVLPGLQQ